MFEYIRGMLTEISPTRVVVDIHGLGYSILIPLNQYAALPPLNSSILLYVAHIVKEDSQKLYGFATKESKELFCHLIEVSGVGPKTALALIGHLSPAEFQAAVAQGNATLISRVPGIGKKTAERLIIDMRDKVKKGVVGERGTGVDLSSAPSVVSDALSALLNLGYNTAQAQKAIQTALSSAEEEPALPQLITLALRSLK